MTEHTDGANGKGTDLQEPSSANESGGASVIGTGNYAVEEARAATHAKTLLASSKPYGFSTDHSPAFSPETQQQSTQKTWTPRYNEEKPGQPFKKYSNKDEMWAAYFHIARNYEHDPAAEELRDTLRPFIGKVDRIVVVGLGEPTQGTESCLLQCAMLYEAAHVLQAKGQPKLEIYISEPFMSKEDFDFLRGELRQVHMLHFERGSAHQVGYNRPLQLTLHLPEESTGQIRKVTEPTWDLKRYVAGAYTAVTSRTLLFMPNVATGLTLRIVQHMETPAIIITNKLNFLWRRAILKEREFDYLRDEDRNHFGAQWASLYAAWKKLRDGYKRHEFKHRFLDGRGDNFCAYVPLVTGREGNSEAKEEWVSGVEGLNLDIQDAIKGSLEG